MLSQIIYLSKRNTNCTSEEIDKILASCKKNNPPLDITGVLLYSDLTFLQCVEGESKVIKALYDKIKDDDRHRQCIMISFGPIKYRKFPSWHMGSKKIANNPAEYDTDISDSDSKVFASILEGNQADGEIVRDIMEKFFK